MRARAIRFHELALEDFDRAVIWYDAKRDGLGLQLLASFEETLDQMIQTPDRFAVAFGKIRRAPVKRFPYSIYYEFEDGQLHIVGLTHHRRDTAHLHSRTESKE